VRLQLLLLAVARVAVMAVKMLEAMAALVVVLVVPVHYLVAAQAKQGKVIMEEATGLPHLMRLVAAVVPVLLELPQLVLHQVMVAMVLQAVLLALASPMLAAVVVHQANLALLMVLVAQAAVVLVLLLGTQHQELVEL